MNKLVRYSLYARDNEQKKEVRRLIKELKRREENTLDVVIRALELLKTK